MGLTQAQLQDRSGLSQATISRLERGDSQGFYEDTQRRIAEALRTTREYLCGETDEVEPLVAPLDIQRRAPDVPQMAAPPPDMDAALARAFDPATHHVLDLIAVRVAMQGDYLAPPRSDLERASRLWLDAAAKLRAQNVPVTAQSLLVQITTHTDND